MLLQLKFPYWGWILSICATFSAFYFMKKIDANQWTEKLGINFKRSEILHFLISFILLLFLSYFTVDYLATQGGVDFKPKLFFYKTLPDNNYSIHSVLASYLYYIPQTFNEEMLIGALLLLGMKRKFKKLNKTFISIIVALIFSLMHQGLYRWSPVQSGELLTLTTISSLFFVGILRNSLILKTGNISLSWAIHLSFNIIFFSGFLIKTNSQDFLSEPAMFNLIFGHPIMLSITGALALMSVIYLHSDRLKIISSNSIKPTI